MNRQEWGTRLQRAHTATGSRIMTQTIDTIVRPMGLLAGLVLLLFALAPAPASAQVDAESFAKLGFNFSPPGAQSAALGGAYIPLAKDATAAETNPAGLTVLLEPEVSFEFKAIEYTRTLPREAGGPAEFTDEVALPSFASVVLPTSRLTFAAFRHELVNYRSTVWSPGFDRGNNTFLNPFTSILDIQVVNWGASLAFQLSPTLSVGVSGGVSQLDMLVDFPRYNVGEFSDQFLKNRLSMDESGSSAFVNLGALLQLGEKVTLGGVYKFRSQFDDLEFLLTDFEGGGSNIETGGLDIPDALGGGLAVRPTDRLTLSVDAVWNQYSQIAEDIAIVFSNESSENYVADDGVDVHAGAELLLFLGRTPLALRGGVARLAPSNTYYVGNNATERGLWGTEAADAETQASFGVGLVLGRRLSVDAAGTFADARSQFVLSAGVFLGS